MAVRIVWHHQDAVGGCRYLVLRRMIHCARRNDYFFGVASVKIVSVHMIDTNEDIEKALRSNTRVLRISNHVKEAGLDLQDAFLAYSITEPGACLIVYSG